MFLDSETYERLKPDFQRVAALVKVGHGPLRDGDRADVIRCVAVARERLPAGELDAIIERFQRKLRTTKLDSKIAYFKKSILTACEDAGVDFHFASKFDVPPRPVPAVTAEGAVA